MTQIDSADSERRKAVRVVQSSTAGASRPPETFLQRHSSRDIPSETFLQRHSSRDIPSRDALGHFRKTSRLSLFSPILRLFLFLFLFPSSVHLLEADVLGVLMEALTAHVEA